MRLSCQHCAKQFSVHQDKIPETGKFVFTCPECGTKNKVSLDTMSGGDQSAPDRGASEKRPSGAGTSEPEFFPPGSLVGFLFLQDESWILKASDFLQDKGYYISRTTSPGEAVHKLRLNSYDFVFIEEINGYADLLEEISRWPGRQRREVNCLILGSYQRSFDPDIAFVRGMNCAVSSNDLDQAELILEQAGELFGKLIEPWHSLEGVSFAAGKADT